MLGAELVDSVRIVNHDARNPESLVWLGRMGADVPVWLNRDWVEADVRITTGVVEPHFFAGFSGGPKMVAPGLAGSRDDAHPSRRCADRPPRCSLGRDRRQPGARRRARHRGRDRNRFRPGRDHRRRAAHRRGVRRRAVRDASSGLRCGEGDRDGRRPRALRCRRHVELGLSRSTRTSTRRSRACRLPPRSSKPGGMIVCLAECRDGFPDHGSYRSELASAPSPQALLDSIVARTEDGARSVADPGPGGHPGTSAGCHAHLVPHGRASWPQLTWSRRTTSRRPCRWDWRRPARPPASASCPRAAHRSLRRRVGAASV